MSDVKGRGRSIFCSFMQFQNTFLAELFDLWMLENPTESDRAANIAAINASINDYMKGERGTPAGEHSQELRQKYGLNKE